MSEAEHRDWVTEEAFIRFIETQPAGRFERIDGQIVAMAGASRRHDRIVAAALRLIGNALVGQPCEPFTADTRIRIPAGNFRQPDFGIECGSPPDDSLFAAQPRLVAEVLSKSNAEGDILDKLIEYQSVPSIDIVLFIDPDWPQVWVYHRNASGDWPQPQKLRGLEAVIDLRQWNLVIPLAELYRGLVFRPRPMLAELSAPPDEPERSRPAF